MSVAKPKYRRILLKLSGESLCGPQGYGIDPTALTKIAQEMSVAVKLGVELALVVGGGNLWRGRETCETTPYAMDRVTADYIGMLATVMNAMALQDALERQKYPTRVLTAIEIAKFAEPFIRRRAVRHLEKRRIVIFAGGTGNPYFSTDTAAALRAIEIHADVLLKGTKVDGVYVSDPQKNPQAKMYRTLSYQEAIEKRLAIMDSAAFSLCQDNSLPVIVFNLFIPGNFKRIILGDPVGTVIK